RDEWLLRALDASTERHAPVLIMQAEMHLKHKQYQAALATLQQLEARGEITPRAIMLLARIHRQTRDWRALAELEPQLRATRGVSRAFADETVAQIYLDRLKEAGDARDVQALRTAWKELPRSLTQRAEIV